jgi:hypothetical protein
MSLNLHATVRGAIQTVNADRSISYLKSTGYTPNSSGKQLPQYASPVSVKAQIQPPSGRDLRHMEFLNIQGTTRVVFLYSNPQAIVRVAARGGDLLQFPQFTGAPVDNWLIAADPETWDVEQNAAVTFTGEATLVLDSATLDVTEVIGGTLNVGDSIQGPGIPAGTTIAALGTGTGGVGTYTMSAEASANLEGSIVSVSATASISGWSKVYAVLQTDRPS